MAVPRLVSRSCWEHCVWSWTGVNWSEMEWSGSAGRLLLFSLVHWCYKRSWTVDQSWVCCFCYKLSPTQGSTGFSSLLNPPRTVRSSACNQFLARPSGSIPISFKSRLQLSLKSSAKGPARLYIVASAQLMMSFGMRRAPLGALTQKWQAVLA